MKNSKKIQKIALMLKVNKFQKETQPTEASKVLNAIKGLK